MPQFARSLDVYQGFNFKKDKQSSVGYITKLKVGDVELTADQETIKDPEQPDKALATKVVGVLNHYLWETGITDAMYFSAQISTNNKQIAGRRAAGHLGQRRGDVQLRHLRVRPGARRSTSSRTTSTRSSRASWRRTGMT